MDARKTRKQSRSNPPRKARKQSRSNPPFPSNSLEVTSNSSLKMTGIPRDVYEQILSWLPVEPLLRCRCVCKEWMSIIDDRNFSRLHFDRQQGSDMLLMRSHVSGYLFAIPLGCLRFSTTSAIRMFEVKRIPKPTSYYLQSVLPTLHISSPSCHGIALVSSLKFGKDHVLWYPLTVQSFVLPSCTDDNKEALVLSTGLGYDSLVENDYKAVFIVQKDSIDYRNPKALTYIYSLKCNAWRRIEDFPTNGRAKSTVPKNGVFSAGSLYWIRSVVMEQGHMVEFVFSLDLATETYSRLQLPWSWCTCNPKKYKNVRKQLHAFQGNLFLSFSSRRLIDLRSRWTVDCFYLWILGEGHNWNELITVNRPHIIRTSWNLEPVAYVKEDNKELILLKYNLDKYMWYDVQTKECMIKIKVEGEVEGDVLYSKVLPAVNLKWLKKWSGPNSYDHRLNLRVRSWYNPQKSWFSWPGMITCNGEQTVKK